MIHVEVKVSSVETRVFDVEYDLDATSFIYSYVEDGFMYLPGYGLAVNVSRVFAVKEGETEDTL